MSKRSATERALEKRNQTVRVAPHASGPGHVVSHQRTQLTLSAPSPLPPPDLLEGYQSLGLLPDVVAMLKAEGEHRQALERADFLRVQEKQAQELELIKADLRNGWRMQRRGQWLAFGIAMVGILGGGGIALLGCPGAGGSIGVASIGTLAVAFLKRSATVISEQPVAPPVPPEPSEK